MVASSLREALVEIVPLFHFTYHAHDIDMTTLLLRSFRGRLLGLVAVAVVAAAGCSDKSVKKVTVHGTISYRGQPLRSGILKFIGPERSYSSGMVQPDGSFIITDVVPGEVKVGVTE